MFFIDPLVLSIQHGTNNEPLMLINCAWTGSQDRSDIAIVPEKICTIWSQPLYYLVWCLGKQHIGEIKSETYAIFIFNNLIKK